jgi:hypothetical protein
MTEPYVNLFTPRDSHNYRVFVCWLSGAMAVFAASTILIDGDFLPHAADWALTAVTAFLMVMSMCSYGVFLRHADELLRKVNLDALAFAFGAGVVVMMVYRLCERLGAPKLDFNDPSLIMILTWMAGQWIGARRYAAAVEQ